jgi:hypothetical protein
MPDMQFYKDFIKWDLPEPKKPDIQTAILPAMIGSF